MKRIRKRKKNPTISSETNNETFRDEMKFSKCTLNDIVEKMGK